MNKHQKALLYMLKAAVQCPEFMEGYGDGKYLFSNMVAKYTLSATRYRFTEGALNHFVENGGDVNKVYTRNSLYGKKSPYIFEHSVPASVIRELIKNSPNDLENILLNAGDVIIALRTEDDKLRECGYQSNMTEGWCIGDNTISRYLESGIDVSDTYLEMTGAIKR